LYSSSSDVPLSSGISSSNSSSILSSSIAITFLPFFSAFSFVFDEGACIFENS
jgi:hypothetical protein